MEGWRVGETTNIIRTQDDMIHTAVRLGYNSSIREGGGRQLLSDGVYKRGSQC